MPRNGSYRHQITIQEPTETVDGFGQAIKSWATYATPFASVEPLRGREYFASAQNTAEVTVRIRMHFDSGVTEKMRVSFNSKLYNIQSIIDPVERNRELQLMCSEGSNDG